jgi:hypothetical protein
MKRRWLIIPFLTLAFTLTLTLLPIGFIYANPGNLIKDSGFNDGLSWCYEEGNVGIVDLGSPHDNVLHIVGDDKEGSESYWEGAYWQIHTSNKNLYFSLDWNLLNYNPDGSLDVGFTIYDESWSLIGSADFNWQYSPGWNHDRESIKHMWADTHSGESLPGFSWIEPWVGTWYIAEAYYDNVKLETTGDNEATEEPIPWVRDHEMTCWQVFVNKDNAFEFIFFWPYYNNNWVKIYDMAGNEVFSIDMPKGDPHFIANLPDGMYNVKTFHNGFEKPIQEFLIGKP